MSTSKISREEKLWSVSIDGAQRDCKLPAVSYRLVEKSGERLLVYL